jgi:hypothetical protein
VAKTCMRKAGLCSRMHRWVRVGDHWECEKCTGRKQACVKCGEMLAVFATFATCTRCVDAEELAAS